MISWIYGPLKIVGMINKMMWNKQALASAREYQARSWACEGSGTYY